MGRLAPQLLLLRCQAQGAHAGFGRGRHLLSARRGRRRALLVPHLVGSRRPLSCALQDPSAGVLAGRPARTAHHAEELLWFMQRLRMLPFVHCSI